MILESVVSFLKQCPLLKNGTFSVDCLSSKCAHYTIDATPATQVIKEYSDGGSLRQFSFVFASREYYGSDILVNLENSGFYEKFSNWLDECTKAKILPYLDGKNHAQSISAQSTGYMYEQSGNTARYQIQCKLIYYKEA